MSLITVNNLAKSFGHIDIFSGISLSIPYRARTAIVGPNGVGKTTLLRILAGLDSPSDGQISRAKDLKFGYLPQEATFELNHTLWDECLTAFTDLRRTEAELHELEAAMSDPSLAETTIERYGNLQRGFDHLGGYTYLLRIEQVLTGLGFERAEFHFPLLHLSGGQRTRALLASLLLSDPDLLILDEPTNHLDINAVEWLENYLSQWNGAALIVSHDRYFLDRVATIILEMGPLGFETYRGNYTAYLMQRQERWERREEIFAAELERLEKEIDYIKRNISGQNVAGARGRLRRLSRYLQAVEQLSIEAVIGRNWGEISEEVHITTGVMGVEEAQRRIRALKPPSSRPPRFHLNLRAGYRSGELVLRTYDLQVGYPNKQLFETENLELRRLECAALIGPNGSGKTTFLKTILGKLPPLAGEISLGASLRIGYFAQAHEELNPEHTLVEEINLVVPNMLLAQVRDYLARFLFSGEEVFKKVAVLSGGERGHLALAKLTLSDANLLLLDEPTNHLDITSQEILQQVLADFQGTILLVSHDRYLIDALATQIWEIDEKNQKLIFFRGTYSEYHAEKEAARQVEHQGGDPSRNQAYQEKSRLDNQELAMERRWQKRLAEVEAHISSLETRLAELAKQLETPPADAVEVERLGIEYIQVEQDLEDMLGVWESLHRQES